MLFNLLLPSLFAAVTVVAAPAPDTDVVLDEAHGEMIKFKRDTILETRDLELAEMHGVNLTEMYQHSIIKRDDGDHITIWVDKGFVHDDEDHLASRQSARPYGDSNFIKGPDKDWCRDHKRQDHTGPNGPTSGGVQAMYRWARDNGGYFGFGTDLGSHWRNLMVAGSNGGTNALYKAKLKESSPLARIGLGTDDLRNDADWTQKRAR